MRRSASQTRRWKRLPATSSGTRAASARPFARRGQRVRPARHARRRRARAWRTAARARARPRARRARRRSAPGRRRVRSRPRAAGRAGCCGSCTSTLLVMAIPPGDGRRLARTPASGLAGFGHGAPGRSSPKTASRTAVAGAYSARMLPERRRLLPGAREPRRPLRRPLLHGRREHGHLLPPDLPRAHAAAAATAASSRPRPRPRRPASGPAGAAGRRRRRAARPGRARHGRGDARAAAASARARSTAGSVDELAARVGAGGRHLRRLFEEHLGASPLAVAQTRRVHFAKKLLDETSLPITEIAHAAGFASLRRFNAAMQQRVRRAAARAAAAARGREPSAALTLRLAARPPFDGRALLALPRAARAARASSRWARTSYRRSVESGGRARRDRGDARRRAPAACA